MMFHQLDPERAYRSSMLWLPKRLVPLDTVKAALTYWFAEPDGKGGMIPKEVAAWREEQHHIVVPREFPQEDIPCEVVDIQRHTEPVDYRPDITPRSTVQSEAMEALSSSRAGILNLACGVGKTIMAIHRIAVGGGPALVVVNNSGILQQWVLELRDRLRLPAKDIGVVQGKLAEWDKPVVVGTVQTLFRRLAGGIPPWAKGRFATVIYDEAHHMAAREFNPVAGYFHGDRFGLTATAERTDGNERFYLYHLGPIIYTSLDVDVPPTVYLAHSGIEPTDKERDTFFVRGLVNIPHIRAWQAKSAPRNRAIAALVQSALGDGHKVIVLTHSKRDHIPRLKKLLPDAGEVTSDVKGQDRIDVLRTRDVIVGTVGAAQEGLDRPDLSVGIWATTLANENEFQQGTGRLARSFPGKEEAEAIFIIDNVPKCLEHARLIARYARKRGYKIVKFKL